MSGTNGNGGDGQPPVQPVTPPDPPKGSENMPVPQEAVCQAIEERRLNAWRLKTRGLSCRKIGRALGVSHFTVENDIKAMAAEMREIKREEAEVSWAMIERQIENLEDIADNASTESSDRIAARRGILSAVNLKMDLFGLKAPVKIRVEHGLLDTMTDERADEIIRAAEAKPKPLTVSARILEAPPNGNGNGTAH